MIALGLVVVVALIIGLSVCLTRQTSPPSFVLEPCDVDGITRQCTTEGRIIDFPVFIQTLKTDMNDEKDFVRFSKLRSHPPSGKNDRNRIHQGSGEPLHA